MSRRLCLTSAVAALLLLHGAAAQAVFQRPSSEDCIAPSSSLSSQSDPNIRFFPSDLLITGQTVDAADHVTVSFAQGFEVDYYDTYKVVRNTLVNETYALYQCGLQPPFQGSLPPGTKQFSIPLTSVAVVETVPLAFMSALGVAARIQSVSEYAVGACGQALLGCPGKTAPSLDTTTPASTAQSLSALAPLVDAVVTSSNYTEPQTFAFSAAQDPGVLRRAEWIKFLGLFFNMDAAASLLFNGINDSYYQTRADVQAQKPEQPPVMAFVDFLDYEPDQAYEVQFAPYKLQYTEDAGAVPPDFDDVAAIPGVVPSPFSAANSTLWFTWGSAPDSFASQEEARAAFHAFLQTVDIVIDETYAADPTAYDLSTFLETYNITDTSGFPFLASSQVYREDGLVGPAPAYGLDWFEGAIVRPDLVLGDFAAAVAPQRYEGRTPTWIRNVAKGGRPVVQTAQDCNQVSSCTPTPTPICPYISLCPNGQVTSQQAANVSCVYAPCA